MRRQEHGFSWTRGIIELLIVTAGVLLALALDQWMDSRKDRAEEALLLGAMRSEFAAILEDMDSEMLFRKAMLENANQVFDLATSGTRPNPAEFDLMLGKLLWWSNVDFTTGAANSVLVGGKLRLIRNEELRFFLAALPGLLETTKQTEGNDYKTLMDHSVPYLSTRADTSQIVAMMNVRPGVDDRNDPPMRYFPKPPRDHTVLLEETGFRNLVGGVAASQMNVMAAYQEVRPKFERAIALIDAELADR